MGGTPRVAIIGGGIGGFAAAIALHQRGIEVQVYEQARRISEIGAGLNMTPNAQKTFRALGLESQVLAIGYEADSQLMRSWRSGRVISREPIKGAMESAYGAARLTIHRADLLQVLSEAVPASLIHLEARCTSVEPGEQIARACFADGNEIEADVIVGADGLHSVVRTGLFGEQAPRFTHCVCWRWMVPVDAIPARLRSRDSAIWMGPHGHVVHYWVRGGELLNVVAHYDSDAWTEESWTREADRDELLQTYARWHPDLLSLCECGERYYKWALYDREPMERWSVGRTTLLGDAAHPMLPYLGQGAAMAIEDAYILAASIAAHRDDLVGALKRYEQLRLPRTRRAQLGSRARAHENHLASRWAQLRRDIKFALRRLNRSDRTAFQTAWLYAYDVAAEHV